MTTNELFARARGWLVWLLPFAVLALLIGWEADWGREWLHTPPRDVAVVPQPLTVAVLPEYQPDATPATRHDMVDRTLFNPTRRPAPVAAAEAAKPRIQRGQFALTGTIVIDGKATAFLKEVAGGKSRRVVQGETINGMLLAEVKPDRVKLKVGDETEELVLKVALNSRPTVQPVAAAPAAAAPAATAAPAGGGAPATQAANAQETANLLAQRRAAARAQEAAANAANTGTAGTAATAASTANPPPVSTPDNPMDPGWAAMDQRMRARAQPNPVAPRRP
jgi:hypothetical protein